MKVRDALKEKVRARIDEALDKDLLLPGVASKLHGALNFASLACAGKVGRMGMPAIIARQYEKDALHFNLSDRLRAALVFFKYLLGGHLERVLRRPGRRGPP
eukprot:1510474-Lingulodinium_polyedra.AAC.1